MEIFRRAKYREKLINIAKDYELTSSRVSTIWRSLKWALENPWQNQERANALLEMLGEDPACMPEKVYSGPKEWMDEHNRSLKQCRRDA